MVKIVFIEGNGTLHEVNAAVGTSVMEAAVRNGVPRIAGACGGACACATCQIYVVGAARALTGERSADEAAMLEYAAGVRESSRLACQIQITADMAGMSVHLPDADT